MTTAASLERLRVVIAGHVDHGKSTVVGRLLAETGAVPEGKLEQVRALCERTSRPFEYAFLLDALRDERDQGITIDAARVFFRTARRQYEIIDAPGHVEFLRNLVTGASRAEAALLVIDAQEGVRENSRRHGYLLAMLGIRQIAVLVNKMDLVAYGQAVFDALARDYLAFLAHLDVRPTCFIPVTGRDGDNLARRSSAMNWYGGSTVLETLESFTPTPPATAGPLRVPVQDVYKFTRWGHDRRIIAGTIDSGTVRVGDELVFYPSGKRSRVKSIEAFGRPAPAEATAGQATGFTLTEQIYVTRGEIATRAGDPSPHVTTRLRVSLFWLGRNPLLPRKDYGFRLGTARALARLEEVTRVVDASTLGADETKARVDRHEVAECVLKLNRAVAFDLAHEAATTSRFVLVDDFEIRGGGIVREALPDRQACVRDRVMLRNYKWEPSRIALERRAERYNQRPTLVLVTGKNEAARKTLAKDLEARLFEAGKVVYYLGIGSVLYGVDADISRDRPHRHEHIRRLSEVANILLDAGVILIVTAAELTQEDLELIKTTVEPERIETVWVGDDITTDLECDLHLPEDGSLEEAVHRVTDLLHDKGIIFRAW